LDFCAAASKIASQKVGSGLILEHLSHLIFTGKIWDLELVKELEEELLLCLEHLVF
jgi:hypothetical protein